VPVAEEPAPLPRIRRQAIKSPRPLVRVDVQGHLGAATADQLTVRDLIIQFITATSRFGKSDLPIPGSGVADATGRWRSRIRKFINGWGQRDL
jgi:hypothetical protein